MLCGEAIGMYQVAPEETASGLRQYLHAETAPFEIVVEPFAFTEWARGAAVAAIQSLIDPH